MFKVKRGFWLFLFLMFLPILNVYAFCVAKGDFEYCFDSDGTQVSGPKGGLDDVISYDAQTNTITFNNFSGKYLETADKRKLNLVFKGRNLFTEYIKISDDLIDISGDGELVLEVNDEINSLIELFGYQNEYVGSYSTININDIKITITGNLKYDQVGIDAVGDLNFKNTNINISNINTGVFFGGRFFADNIGLNISNVDTGMLISGTTKLDDSNINITDFSEYGMHIRTSTMEMQELDITNSNVFIDGKSKGIGGLLYVGEEFNLIDGSFLIKNCKYGIFSNEAENLGFIYINGKLDIIDSLSAAILLRDESNFSYNKNNIELSGDYVLSDYIDSLYGAGFTYASEKLPYGYDDLDGEMEIEMTESDSAKVAKSISFSKKYKENKLLEQSKNELKDKDDLTLRFDLDVSKFLYLYVDGKLLSREKGDYTVKSGSTVVTISNKYLSTIKSGNHNVKAVFSDGVASANFKTNIENPNTGMNNLNIVLIIIFTFSILSYLLIRKRSKFQKSV